MAISLSQLPGTADNTWQYNGAPFIQDNVVESGGYQYATWWDSARKPIVGRRVVGGSGWETYDLSQVAGNPLASPVDYDGHNNLSMSVDGSGRLHVAGNMHVHPMRYCRSVGAATLTSWTGANRPGGGETEITYPQFVRLSDTRLLIFYRVGVSGLGTIWVQEWDDPAGVWADPLQVVDGPATGENAYIHHVGVGPDDSIHLAIVWRSSGSATTNNDLSHMVSLDGGATWQAQDGTPLTLPVDHTTAPEVYATAPTGSGILNTCGLDVDLSGRPHIATHIYDAAGSASRVLYSRWSGTVWVNTVVFDDWAYRMPLDVSVINGEIARPGIACTSTGRVVIIYRNNVDTPGSLRIREVTPGSVQRDAAILNVDLYAYEPTFDSRALRDSNRLSLLVTPIRSADTELPDPVGDWTNLPLGILTVDLGHLDAILAGAVQVPNAIADTDPPPDPAPEPVAVAQVRTRLTWLGCDLVSGRIITELPEIRGSISRVLGAYTSTALTLPIPLGGPGAQPITVIEEATAPKTTMIVTVVNDVPSWAGVVLRRAGGTSAELRLSCLSLEGYLDRRYVGDHTWTGRDMASVIAAGLIGDANVQGIGLVVDAPPMGVLADREYRDQDDTTVYSRLRELMAVDGGPEWTVDVDWADPTQTAIAKIIRVRSRIGSASPTPGTIFQTTAPSVFSSVGSADADYEYTEDYSDGRGANWIVATSSGEGESRPQSTPAQNVPAGQARFEHRWSPGPSITDQTVLDGHAAAELALRRDGTNTLQIRARWDAYPNINVNWGLGDDVAWELHGHRHPAGLIGQGRVIGWNLNIQEGLIEPVLWEPGGDV